jgi:FixJ family two-component response regulator
VVERRLSEKTIIAIVDDDQSVRQAVGALLRSVGYSAITFAGAEEFLTCGRRCDISCVIADMQMPGLSGLSLHRQLSTCAKPIPTILITAYPDERMRRQAHEAGVTCFLTKPFAEDDLLACLRSALAMHGQP